MSEKKKDPYSVEGGAGAKPKAAAAGAGSSMFSARSLDKVTVITFEKSEVLDAYEIEQLGDGIYHYVKTIETPRVVVDLGNVKHLSSSAIGMLIALRTVVHKKSGSICIANVSGNLLEIFKLTNLDKIIEFHTSTEAAVASLS